MIFLFVLIAVLLLLLLFDSVLAFDTHNVNLTYKENTYVQIKMLCESKQRINIMNDSIIVSSFIVCVWLTFVCWNRSHNCIEINFGGGGGVYK